MLYTKKDGTISVYDKKKYYQTRKETHPEIQETEECSICHSVVQKRVLNNHLKSKKHLKALSQ